MLERDDQKKPQSAPPCSVCRQPSVAGFWEGQLCTACLNAWHAAPRDFEAAEFAHAAAHPEDVEASGTLLSGKRWVSLKSEAHVELCRSVARAWVSERRKLKVVAPAAAEAAR